MIKKPIMKMKKIEQFAAQKARGRDYNHDMNHIYRTVRLAKYIAKKEKDVMDVCAVSAMLHDIGQSIRVKDHHITGAKMARKFLKGLKLDDDFIEEVAYCIYCHSSRTVKESKTIEAKVLYDADMLQCIGPFGYTRLLTTFTVFDGMGLLESIDEIKNTEKKVKRLLQTKTGRKLAEDLFKFMKGFYKRYEKWDKAKI